VVSTKNIDINIATESPRVEICQRIASAEFLGKLRVKGVIAVGREQSRFRSSKVDPRHSVKPMLTDEATSRPCKLNYSGTASAVVCNRLSKYG